jgi:hypothetical protein
MNIYIKNQQFESMAMSHIKADTSKIFLQVRDSLDKHRDVTLHEGLYQNSEVFRYLGMDTTARFHFLVDSFRKDEKEKAIQTHLTHAHFDLSTLIDLCGYINDERLINPLLRLLEKPEKFKDYDPEFLQRCVNGAFVQMNIDPYPSEFLESQTLSPEEIKEKKIVPYIVLFAEFLHSQESFRELSKYLLSSAYTIVTGDGDFEGVAYKESFRYIMKYIENEDLWKIIGDPGSFNIEEGRFKIYEWMQENYGKYKIKRLW